MTSHRQLQAATKRGAVNRHHDRLPGILNLEKQRQESRASGVLAGSHLAKFLDIRTGNECASASNQHSRTNRVVFAYFFDGFGNASGTPGLRAFTGGLLIVMIAMSESLVSWTRSLIGFPLRNG